MLFILPNWINKLLKTYVQFHIHTNASIKNNVNKNWKKDWQFFECWICLVSLVLFPNKANKATQARNQLSMRKFANDWIELFKICLFMTWHVFQKSIKNSIAIGTFAARTLHISLFSMNDVNGYKYKHGKRMSVYFVCSLFQMVPIICILYASNPSYYRIWIT